MKINKYKLYYLFLVLFIGTPLFVNGQESKNGHKVTPRGTIRVLVVFAELVGGCGGTPTNNWPTGTAAPPNADMYLDYVVNSTPVTKLTKYYKDISLGEYNVIGDYYNGTVQVPCSLYNSYSYPYNIGSAIMQLNNDWQPVGGNYLTKHGLNLNSFDDYPTVADGAVKLPGNPDGVIDVTVILWRNTPNGLFSCGGGLGIGNEFVNYGSQIPLKGKYVNVFGSWEFCPDTYPDRYDDFFIAEYFHSLFGGNNFHTGGGAASGTFMFDATASWSTSAQSGSVSNIVCGWDRKYMNWKGSRQYPISALNQSAQEVVSDISVTTNPNISYYVLRDFVTVGDAIRIKLPHFNWQADGDKKNQYLWLENHQLVSEFDRNKGTPPYSSCTQWVPGLYAYIQVGKDILSGPNLYNGNSSASPNALNDWLYPLPAEGMWDFFYSLSDNNINSNNCAWGNKSTPYSISYPNATRKSNPFTGYNDAYGFIDSDNNGTIFQNSNDDIYQPRWQKWPGIPTVGSPPLPTIPGWGDGLDAFTQLNQKISMATNPSTAPVYTMMEGNNTPNNYDNRSIHLNNMSIQIINTNYYNVTTGPKSFLIAVKWDDNAIDNDVRWCGNVVLANDPLDPQARSMQIDVKPNKIITVDKGLSPTQLIEKTPGSRNFSEPSFLHLLSGTTTTLESGSKINVTNGSTFHVQSGANLIIGPNASVNIDATSFICIEDGANVVFQDAASSRIYINGKPYYDNYEIFNTTFLKQPDNYYALNTIEASGTLPGVVMPLTGTVLLQARTSITLLPNVTIAASASKTFEAKVDNPYNCSNVNNYNLRVAPNNNVYNNNDDISSIIEDGIVTSPYKKEQTTDKTGIEVYPNPNSGVFTLSTNFVNGNIEIVDVLGNRIKQLKINDNSYFQMVDISDYPKGIYIINVISQGNKTTKRVVVQ